MEGFVFPSDVQGWLTEKEGRKLSEIAVGRDVLEIGAYCGRSTICLAQTAMRVLSLDCWDGRATPAPKQTLEKWKDNCERYGVADRVLAIDNSLRFSIPFFWMVDVAFIDADHSADAVREDIRLALQTLRGGLIAFHDYNPGNMNCGVTVAVDEYLATGAKLLSLTDTLAVVEPATFTVQVAARGATWTY